MRNGSGLHLQNKGKFCVMCVKETVQIFKSSRTLKSFGVSVDNHISYRLSHFSTPTLMLENNMAQVSKLSGLAQITEHLYLGSARAAKDITGVSKQQITCIINVTEKADNDVPPAVELVRIPVLDSPATQMIDHFDSVADKIHAIENENGRTLVHCNAGVSRSATLCLAYLMKYRDMSLKDAHSWTKERRPLIRPNSGFWKQLIEYERRLRGTNTVHMVESPVGEIPDLYENEVKDMVALRNILNFT